MQTTGARGESAERKIHRLEQERRRLEAELSAARRQLDEQRVVFRRVADDLENLLASTQVATIFFDDRLRVTRFTRAVTELFSLDDGDLGREIADLDTHLHYPRFATDACTALVSGESVEQRVEAADGRSFLARLLPYRTEHAAVDGVIATFFDITSLELVQRGFEAAQREAADYKYALERSSILAIIDDDGRILHANRHFCEISGFRRDELLGQSVEVLDSGHHPPEFFENMWATIRAGDVWRGEVLNRTRAGRLYWMESTIVPLYGDAGAPERYLSISQDITEPVTARDAVAKSERRFRSLFGFAPLGIAIADLDDVILAANPALGALLGCTPDALVGRRLGELALEEDAAASSARFSELVWGQRERYGLEQRYRRSDGSCVWTSVAVALLRESDADPSSVVYMVQDITEKRAVAEKLRAQAGLARLGEMAAVVAHEVRNPIAGIGSALRIIRDRLPVGPEAAIIGEIQQRLRMLNDTVEDLLRYARPIEPALRPVELEALLRETADRVAGDGGFSDLFIELCCPRDTTVLADPGMLQSLFSNLMLNGAQAMQGAGTVRVSARCAGGRCEVRVADEGPGIPSELRDKVMEPFFTTRSQGTGLGLAIARRIAEAHGGTLECEPETATGTVMRVELPL